MTTQDPLDHDLAAYIRSKGRWPEREHNPLADGLRAVFMERGWTIQMDDRPGQPLDPFPFLDRLVRAAPAATPPAIHPRRLRCPKCGGEDIGTQWHQDTWAGRGRTCAWAEQYAEGQAGEHLHRYCRVCSFQWRDAIEGTKP